MKRLDDVQMLILGPLSACLAGARASSTNHNATTKCQPLPPCVAGEEACAARVTPSNCRLIHLPRKVAGVFGVRLLHLAAKLSLLPGKLAGGASQASAFERCQPLKRASILLALIATLSAHAQVGQQYLNLVSGWNAVWLEVQPAYTNGQPMSPQDLFAAYSAVKVVATPKELAGLGEFFGDAPTNGAYTSFNQEGWSQWHRTGGLLDDLASMSANRPYIIQTTAAVTIPLQGTATFFRPRWTPDRYNLLAFGLDFTSPPTFREFFVGAGARHPLDKIYSMNTAGVWSAVNPDTAMKNGKAYWIFCKGASDYMGPVTVSFPGMETGVLNMGGPADARDVVSGATTQAMDLAEVIFSNLGTTPIRPSLYLQPNLAYPSQAAGDLKLYDVHPATNSRSYVRGPELGPSFVTAASEQIETNQTGYLTIGALRNWSSGRADRVHLYYFKTGAKTEFWLPVRALQNELQTSGELVPAVAGQPDPQRVGLWVGEVLADQVTCIADPARPVLPAAGSAPLRILLHADVSGQVRLLSQVTIMQTKTADPAIEPTPVLVVDTDRIPYFEGIQERRGKRVGLRLETVAYDMPRDLAPAAAPNTYHLDWPLDGYLGAGQTVRTPVAAPLTLDPTHRSNPFRHAYHPQHAQGPTITRVLSIQFDAEQVNAGLLKGRYEETVKGLVYGDLIIRGTVTLRQVSPVAVLEGVE